MEQKRGLVIANLIPTQLIGLTISLRDAFIHYTIRYKDQPLDPPWQFPVMKMMMMMTPNP